MARVSEKETCRIWPDPRLDPRVVCVVEEPKDVLAVECTREFTCRYHVLGGALDPLSGIPDQLWIRELLTGSVLSRTGSGLRWASVVASVLTESLLPPKPWATSNAGAGVVAGRSTAAFKRIWPVLPGPSGTSIVTFSVVTGGDRGSP